MSYTLAVTAVGSAGGTNSLTVNAWSTAQMIAAGIITADGQVVPQGTAAPTGTPAATATTAETQGADGLVYLTLPTATTYYIQVIGSDSINRWSYTAEALIGGAVQSVTAGDSSVTVGGTSTAPTVALPAAGTAGTYGDSSHTLTITTDAKGRVTAVTANGVSITHSAITDWATALSSALTGYFNTAGSGLSSSGSTVSLPAVGSAGTSGDSSHTLAITTDAYGRITGVTSNAIQITQSQVTGLSAALGALAPLASPAFTGTPTAPTPLSTDNSTTLATTAFVQAIASNPLASAKGLNLSLTETVNYPPQQAAPLTGNTGLMIQQYETMAFLPPVVANSTAITYTGTGPYTWTVNFASSILGTFGAIGDTLLVTLKGFAPASYNNGGTQVTATVASSTSITFTSASAPSGTITQWGIVVCPAKQYTGVQNANGAPRAILEIEGDNIFSQSVDQGSGIGPAVQNAMAYQPSAIFTASAYCTASTTALTFAGTNGTALSALGTLTLSGSTAGYGSAGCGMVADSNGTLHVVTWTGQTGSTLTGCTYSGDTSQTLNSGVQVQTGMVFRLSGDQRASLAFNHKIGPNLSTISANSQIYQMFYDGTNTYLIGLRAQSYFYTSFTGTTGTYTLQFVPDVVTGEGFVNAPTLYGLGNVSFPVNNTAISGGSAVPGQSQGWHLGYWDGPAFLTFTKGTINSADNGLALSALSTLTLNASTSSWPAAGQGIIMASDGPHTVTWTGTSGNTLTGCTYSGSTAATVVTNAPVSAGTVSNLNLSNYTATSTLGRGATGAWRIGFNAMDITVDTPFNQITTQIGVLAGQIQPNASNIYPLTGAVNNVGILNASTSAKPSAPPMCLVTSWNSGTSVLTVNCPTLPSGTNSTGGFPTSGTLTINAGVSYNSTITMTYTGISGNTFTGCTITSGSFPSPLLANQLTVWLSATTVGAAVPNSLYFSANTFSFPKPISSTQYVCPTANVTYAGSTNFVMAGVYDGQTITYENIASSYSVTFPSATGASGGYANLSVASGSLVLGPGQVVTLIYNLATNTWVQQSPTASALPALPTPQGGGIKVATLDPGAASGSVTPTSQTVYFYRVDVAAATPLTNILLRVGGTGSTGMTNARFGVMSVATGTFLAQTADQTSTAWTANTNYSIALTGGPIMLQPGSYYFVMWFVGTTPPLIIGNNASGAAFASSAAGSSPWLGNLGRSYSWASQSSWPTSLTAALSVGTGIALLGAN